MSAFDDGQKRLDLFKTETMSFSTKQLFLCLLLTLPFVFIACDDEEVEIPNEEEVITNFTLTLTPEGAGTPVVLSFVDIDGEGGADGVYTTSPLAANTTYAGSVTLLNTSDGANEDITREIEEEDDEHQLFYQIASDLNLTVAYEDADGNNNPVGLLTTITTTDASTGTLTVTLRHEPAKDASGVSDGDITNAGGETDIEVVFDVEIQ